MALTRRQRQYLRAQAHRLRPVVAVGAAGLSPNVLRELDASIAHHELIKLKLASADDPDGQAAAAAAGIRAELVAVIGRTAVLFRPRPDGSRFVLPGN